VANSQFDERLLSLDTTPWTVAQGTGAQGITQTSYGNQRYDALYIDNRDTIAHTYIVSVGPQGGQGTVVASGTVQPPALGVVVSVEALALHLPTGKQFLIIPDGYIVRAELAEAVLSDNAVVMTIQGGSI
jgi:hypothetical protein